MDAIPDGTHTFHVKINDGPVQAFRCRTGIYQLAAAAALAMLKYKHSDDGRDDVAIWSPHHLKRREHGLQPFYYRHDHDDCGNLVMRHLVRGEPHHG